MKKILSACRELFLCLAFLLSINADVQAQLNVNAPSGESISYYYKGKKIYYPVSYDMIVGEMEPGYSFSELKKNIAGMSVASDSIGEIGTGKQFMIKLGGSDESKRSAAFVSSLKAVPGLLYARPVFKCSSGVYGSYGTEFIVNLKSSTTFSEVQTLIDKNGCTLARKYPFQDDVYILAAGKNAGYDGLAMANLFYETGLFDYAEPNSKVYGALQQSADPMYNIQWAHKNTGPSQFSQFQYPTLNIPGAIAGADMKIEEAWNLKMVNPNIKTMGDPDIKIAVMDDGVDLTHPDLQANLLPGYNAHLMRSLPGTDGAPIPPSSSHGTKCAGIIAAIANNNIGVAGVAPNCKIIPVAIFTYNAVLQQNELVPIEAAAAFDFVREQGADVISCSWFLPFRSSSLEAAFDRAVTLGREGKGCMVFFGSGNENASEISPQSSYPKVISVGGVNMCEQRKTPTSCDGENWTNNGGANYGEGLDVVAPCSKLATTDIQGNGNNNGDYNERFNGTSAACPLVAGVGALILSVDKSLTVSHATEILELSCDKVGSYSYTVNPNQPNGLWNIEMGHGRVNAYRAVRFASFKVTFPDVAEIFVPFKMQKITWNPGFTNDNNPILKRVKILLSTDGGVEFLHELNPDTENDGQEMVLIPNVTTYTARIKVQIIGDIVYDVSDTNFAIINLPNRWTPLDNSPLHDNGGVMLLLSDGSVICKAKTPDGKTWDKLTPDASGSYVKGTWTTIAPMQNDRRFFSSQILKDGRIYVAGGLKDAAGNHNTVGAKEGEIYDPQVGTLGTWTPIPSSGYYFYDGNSEILENGTVLQAAYGTSQFTNPPPTDAWKSTLIYNPDPVINSYSYPISSTGSSKESSWLKLPDNSILMVTGNTNTKRYIPAQNAWIPDDQVPVDLFDLNRVMGPAFLLPDGSGFFLGGNGQTLYYTPSGNTGHGSWTIGRNIHYGGFYGGNTTPPGPVMGAPDAPAAMMNNGKILCAVSHTAKAVDDFPSPTYFYEFDYRYDLYAAVAVPGGNATMDGTPSEMQMLNLPNGEILYSNSATNPGQYYVYQPDGSPLAEGKPVITKLEKCGTLTLTGTGFNGISEGAGHGNEWQMSTNFPIVSLTDGSDVYYATTKNWNSRGVRRGSAPDVVEFTLPAEVQALNEHYDLEYDIRVIANGIASDPIVDYLVCNSKRFHFKAHELVVPPPPVPQPMMLPDTSSGPVPQSALLTTPPDTIVAEWLSDGRFRNNGNRYALKSIGANPPLVTWREHRAIFFDGHVLADDSNRAPFAPGIARTIMIAGQIPCDSSISSSPLLTFEDDGTGDSHINTKFSVGISRANNKTYVYTGSSTVTTNGSAGATVHDTATVADINYEFGLRSYLATYIIEENGSDLVFRLNKDTVSILNNLAGLAVDKNDSIHSFKIHGGAGWIYEIIAFDGVLEDSLLNHWEDYLYDKYSLHPSTPVMPTAPTIQAIPNDTICAGESVTLSITAGNLNAATGWVFRTESCDHGYVAGQEFAYGADRFGPTATFHPLVTTTYYIRGEGACDLRGPCESVTITVLTSLDPIPVLTATSGSRCVGELDTLIITNGNSLNPGAKWKWYAHHCCAGYDLAGEGDTLIVGSGIDTFFARSEGPGCLVGTAWGYVIHTVQPIAYVMDADEDGWSVGGPVTFCPLDPVPAGYVQASIFYPNHDSDCDDNNDDIHTGCGSTQSFYVNPLTFYGCDSATIIAFTGYLIALEGANPSYTYNFSSANGGSYTGNINYFTVPLGNPTDPPFNCQVVVSDNFGNVRSATVTIHPDANDAPTGFSVGASVYYGSGCGASDRGAVVYPTGLSFPFTSYISLLPPYTYYYYHDTSWIQFATGVTNSVWFSAPASHTSGSNIKAVNACGEVGFGGVDWKPKVHVNNSVVQPTGCYSNGSMSIYGDGMPQLEYGLVRYYWDTLDGTQPPVWRDYYLNTFGASSVFTNLPQGTYFAAIKDGCGNIRHSGAVVLGSNSPYIDFPFDYDVPGQPCVRRVHVDLYPGNEGTGPVEYGIQMHPGEHMQWQASPDFFVSEGSYHFTAKDACGRVSSWQQRDISIPHISVSGQTIENQTCGKKITLISSGTAVGNKKFGICKLGGTLATDTILQTDSVFNNVHFQECVPFIEDSCKRHYGAAFVLDFATPEVSIKASPSAHVAPGGSVTFTATVTDGGLAPTFKWFKNGVQVIGQTGPTFTVTNPNDYDEVHCTALGDLNCTIDFGERNSGMIQIRVITNPCVPEISISSVVEGAHCEIRHTANIVNGGNDPVFEWKINGATVGTDATYLSTALLPTEHLSCTLTSSLDCSLPQSVTATASTFVSEDPGSIDRSFNKNGIGPNLEVTLAVAQHDDKILIGGNFYMYNANNSSTSNNAFLMRLNSDGSPDAGFTSSFFQSSVKAAALQFDGKIIVAGGYLGAYINSSPTIYGIYRLLDNGDIDPAFNTGGVGVEQGRDILSVAFDFADSTILIAGNFTSYNGQPVKNLARLNPDGTLDNTFSAGTGTELPIKEVIAKSNGKIIIAGDFADYDGNAVTGLVQLNNNGSIDPGFNTNIFDYSYYHELRSLSLQADGTLILAGSFDTPNGNVKLVRVDIDGNLDAGFNLPDDPDNALIINSTEIAAGGNVIIGGSRYNYAEQKNHPFVRRVLSDGSYDASFNDALNEAQTIYKGIAALCLQLDSKIVAGGEFNDNVAGKINLLRIGYSTSCETLCPPVYDTVEVATPDSYYNYFGINLFNDGYYVKDALTNSAGCDSIVILKLTLNASANIYYLDADGDGFGGHTDSIQAFIKPSGYSANNTDCDDAVGGIHAPIPYFVDGDLDGYGSTTTAMLCSLTAPSGYSTNNTDCDTVEINKWQSALLYIDADGDEYDNGTSTVCYGDSIPSGYSATTSGSDCDDTDSLILRCTAAISGAIHTEQGNPISTVMVKLSGSKNQTDTTGNDGLYNFTVDADGDYTITPFKGNDSLTSICITTIDLVRMQRHILAIDTLSSPYKIMAADVNGSGNVTTIDIAIARGVILGNTTTFTNSRLWRFVNSDFAFGDTLHPFPFDSTRTYNNLSADTINQNFIGIRLGDVSGTCDIPNPRMSVAGEVQFAMEEYNAMPGDEIIIPVKVKDFKNIAGYQFTLSWDVNVLSFLEVNNVFVSAFYGTNDVNGGFLTTSWNDATGRAKSLDDEAVVFELKFKVAGAIGSFSLINIGSEITTSEAYNDGLELLSIHSTNGKVNVGEIATHNPQPATHNTAYISVQPNPFKNTTNIIFRIAKSETVSISIYDLLGKEVKRIEANYLVGEHKIEWGGEDKNGAPLSSGLYHIRMKVGNATQGVKVALVR